MVIIRFFFKLITSVVYLLTACISASSIIKHWTYIDSSLFFVCWFVLQGCKGKRKIAIVYIEIRDCIDCMFFSFLCLFLFFIHCSVYYFFPYTSFSPICMQYIIHEKNEHVNHLVIIAPKIVLYARNCNLHIADTWWREAYFLSHTTYFRVMDFTNFPLC